MAKRFWTGLAIGIGATLVAPIVFPALSQVAKPAAKTLVKSGLVLYKRGRIAYAEASESFGDMLAEASHELEQEAAGTPPAEPANVVSLGSTPR